MLISVNNDYYDYYDFLYICKVQPILIICCVISFKQSVVANSKEKK